MAHRNTRPRRAPGERTSRPWRRRWAGLLVSPGPPRPHRTRGRGGAHLFLAGPASLVDAATTRAPQKLSETDRRRVRWGSWPFMIIVAWFAAWMIIAFSDGRLGGAAVVRRSARRGARLDQEGLSDLARGDLDRRKQSGAPRLSLQMRGVLVRRGQRRRCRGRRCPEDQAHRQEAERRSAEKSVAHGGAASSRKRWANLQWAALMRWHARAIAPNPA